MILRLNRKFITFALRRSFLEPDLQKQLCTVNLNQCAIKTVPAVSYDPSLLKRPHVLATNSNRSASFGAWAGQKSSNVNLDPYQLMRFVSTTRSMENEAAKPLNQQKVESDAKKTESATKEGQETVEPAVGSPSTARPPDKKTMLKQAVKDYGATVIVFHVIMSLGSLGFFYTLVSSGLDVVAFMENLGVGKAILESKITQGASTFVVAYAVHKVFAPVRITITLTTVPFLVKYLRRVGVLKMPKS